MTNELIYTITGERQRGEVSSYHHKPNPLFLNKSKFKNDIAGLKKSDRKALRFDGGGDSHTTLTTCRKVAYKGF